MGIIIIIGIIGVIIFICSMINQAHELNKRPERFADKIAELKRYGAKIIYSNQQTGTITYSKCGITHSISVYRGYNSHCKNY